MADIAVENADKQAQMEFASGFTHDLLAPETAAVVEGVPVIEEPAAVEAQAEPVAEEPKYVQITQEQIDSWKSAAEKTAKLEAQLSKVFGTMGDMQQVVRALQSATPAGITVEIPADAFADMEKDFPELAAQSRSALEKALKGIRGTASVGTVAAPDPEIVNKLVRDGMSAETIKREVAALEEDHPKWREIVGTVDANGQVDPNNDFRKWLAKEPIEYQTKINSTNSAATISKAIEKFQASKTAIRPVLKQAPKIAARAAVIREAIQPKGDGGQPNPANSADDDFNSGFKTG